jgi:hypothetical protein
MFARPFFTGIGIGGAVARSLLPHHPTSASCCMVRVNRSTLSHDSVTCNRAPAVSSIAFDAQPLDLPAVPLMDVGFAILCSLARHRRPPIQFCPSARVFAPRLFQTSPRGLSPSGFASTSPPSGCAEDLHLQAIEHARHTTRRRSGTRRTASVECSLSLRLQPEQPARPVAR